jgi:hypothetical protein
MTASDRVSKEGFIALTRVTAARTLHRYANFQLPTIQPKCSTKYDMKFVNILKIYLHDGNARAQTSNTADCSVPKTKVFALYLFRFLKYIYLSLLYTVREICLKRLLSTGDVTESAIWRRKCRPRQANALPRSLSGVAISVHKDTAYRRTRCESRW